MTLLATLKRAGFGDADLGQLAGLPSGAIRAARLAVGLRPGYAMVDTCAAEFAAETPYHYSTYEDDDEVRPSSAPKVVILGSGPNRIGQGIEFDYCCVHASFALRDAGYETVMVNCNPETVSTDYDTSDRLYFEPITFEDVMNIVEMERPEDQVEDLARPGRCSSSGSAAAGGGLAALRRSNTASIRWSHAATLA